MLNPMMWSIPFFRLFGVQVRVHILFFLVTLGMFFREAFREGSYVAPLDVFLFTVVMLFGIVLIHEFGHVFGGRSVGGDCDEVLLWPLGGLAYVSVPNDWRSNFITSAAGPLTNLLQCFLVAMVLAVVGFVPSLIPWDNPYVSPMYNFQDGRVYTSEYGFKVYEPNTNTAAEETNTKHSAYKPEEAVKKLERTPHLERAVAPTWIVWLNRYYWLNAILLLLNLLPAFPLDGGQMLQALVWRRSGLRHGTLVACVAGYITAMVMILVAFSVESVPLVMLLTFIGLSSYLKLRELQEGSEFATDVGEEDDEDRPKTKSVSFFKRWQQNRTAKKLQREHVQRTQDDERMDQLLEKIASKGKDSLTAEERAFMQRVSQRYRR
jgi:stage IV sporulation protein FB